MDVTLKDERDAARREVDRLNRQLDDVTALMDAYGAAQWRRGRAGQERQTFADWRKEMGQ